MPSPLSRREPVRRFKALGFEGPLSGGKHQFMKQGELKIRIPTSHKGDVSGGLLEQILRQADIAEDVWDRL